MNLTHRARAFRAAALVVVYSSAFAAVAAVAAPAGANPNSLPYLTVSKVAISNAGGCRPDAPASLAEPVFVEMPEIAQGMRLDGTATLRVDLAPDGSIKDTRVMTSTDNPWLDGAALDAVRHARFQAETRACHAVAGAYRVAVVFPEF